VTQISELVRRAVQFNATKPATVFGGRIRIWEEFQDRISRLAGALHGCAFKAGDRIGILALNSDRYLECLFGLSWGGFVFVPINTRLAPPEIALWLADAECVALFVDDAFIPVLPKVLPNAPSIQRTIHLGDGERPPDTPSHDRLIAGAEPLAAPIGSDNDLTGLFYTGGTTGRSKGVMLSHNNILANALATYPGALVDDGTRYIHAAPMFHMADNAMTFMVTGFGGTHYFLPRFDPAEMIRAIAEHRITHSLVVPTMANMIANHPDVERCDLSSLRSLVYGGSPMPEAVIARVLQVLPLTQLTQLYGQSEASPVLTSLYHRYHCFEGPYAGRTKSAGRAVLGSEVRIHDPEDNETPRGTVGEICARGPMVMLGYWKQPELSAHTLRNGWLHTGDAGYMDEEGYLYVADRLKDMIISGGENVYSAEVEAALYSHPAVAECAVIGVPDDEWGERVHAVVRLKPEVSATLEILIAHCHERIAGYKCPRSIDLRDEPLPLSGAGKILKTKLREPFWRGRERQVA
jgi:long-chain acyl-CoA synthetase